MMPYKFPLPDNVTMCPATRQLWGETTLNEAQLARFRREDLEGPTQARADSMIYLHVPFCDSFCHFCYFTVFKTPGASIMQHYMDAMKAEIETYLSYPSIHDHPWEVVYFGGGTPSVIPVDMMAEFIDWLRDTFPNGRNLKIEFEGEARTVHNPELLQMLGERGCSRISIGTQTFDPDLRKRQNLKPTWEEIEAVCENTRAAGIEGINFDLLYWLPGQTLDHVRTDIRKSVELGVTDIDYLITRPDPINQGDPHSKLLYAGRLPPMPSIDAVLEMRDVIASDLIAAGYERQYGHFFSRTAKPRYHNNRYGGLDGMSQTLGIGVSSRGFVGRTIYRNHTKIGDYLEGAGKEPKPMRVGEMTEERRLQRIFYFFPRYMSLSDESLRGFADEMVAPYLDRMASLEQRGLVRRYAEEGDSGYELSELGMNWYSNISSEIVTGLERTEEIASRYWDFPDAPLAKEGQSRWVGEKRETRWGNRLPEI